MYTIDVQVCDEEPTHFKIHLKRDGAPVGHRCLGIAPTIDLNIQKMLEQQRVPEQLIEHLVGQAVHEMTKRKGELKEPTPAEEPAPVVAKPRSAPPTPRASGAFGDFHYA